MTYLSEIINNFEKQNILILGDAMLDEYVMGNTLRVSPEAPVLVVKAAETKYSLGGAANTAANINRLLGTATLVGLIGDDYEGQILIEQLKKKRMHKEGLVKTSRRTTLKTRVVADNQHLIRIDKEEAGYIGTTYENKLKKSLDKMILDCDAIIVSDYAKGVITKSIITYAKNLAKAKGIPIVADTRPEHKKLYKNCDYITPNLKEAMEMSGVKDKGNIDKMAAKLIEGLNCNVLLTRAEEGLALFLKEDYKKGYKEQRYIEAIAPKDVRDVTGAGDTVVATFTLALASGATPYQAANLANCAASVVVGKFGSATLTQQELREAAGNSGRLCRDNPNSKKYTT